MATFQPRIGTKGQLSQVSVTNGQFIVLTDSREIYVDMDGARVQVAASPFDAESIPLATRPAVLFAINGLVRSIPMGADGEVLTVKNGALAWSAVSGEGGGMAVESTAYPVVNGRLNVSPSISGGSQTDGLTQFTPLELPIGDIQPTRYQIFS